MADADARAPPKSEPGATPIGSISPSSHSSAAAAGEEEVEEQLAGLAIAHQGDLLLPKPTGWEDGPVVGGDVGGGGADETSGEKLPGEVAAVGVAEGAAVDSRPRFPRRPGEPDCTYYAKFGSCRFGMKCKFNHPSRKKKSRVKGSNGGSGSGSNSSSNKATSPDDEQAPKEEYGSYVPDISPEVDSLGLSDKGSTSNSENFKKSSYEIIDVKKGRVEPKELKALKVAKEKRKEFISEGISQEECKYYSTPGGCKFGKSCKYLHRDGKEGKTEAEKVDLNFLGLPLRPGGKECPYYMRTGSCKYATNCKFHHPDPSNVASKDPQLEHENRDIPQQDVQGSSSQPNASIWPDQRTVNEHHVPFIAPSPSYSAGMLAPQGMYPPPEWNGYHQVPLNPYYPPGVPFQHFPAPPINHPMYKAPEIPGHQQVPSEEYPDRPGQPECQHFVKSGFCKFRMKCKYHHPRSLVPPARALSPLGLPIKPDQPVCTYYGRYGICKYGPACAYNHPFNFSPVPAAGPPLLPVQYPTPGNYTL